MKKHSCNTDIGVMVIIAVVGSFLVGQQNHSYNIRSQISQY